MVVKLEVTVLHVAKRRPQQGNDIYPLRIVDTPDPGQVLDQVLAELVTKRHLAIVLDVHALLRVVLYLKRNEYAVDDFSYCAKVDRYNPVALALAGSLDDHESIATLFDNRAAGSLHC